MAPKKILIVDDDVTALDIVDLLFEDEGFEVERRADGISALSSVKNQSPDIVLIDLMMPQMSGQDCVRHMRAAGVSAPIVAFTAVDDLAVHDDARSAGCNLVLTKPCRPATLTRHIRELLHLSQEAK